MYLFYAYDQTWHILVATSAAVLNDNNRVTARTNSPAKTGDTNTTKTRALQSSALTECIALLFPSVPLKVSHSHEEVAQQNKATNIDPWDNCKTHRTLIPNYVSTTNMDTVGSEGITITLLSSLSPALSLIHI